MEASKASWPAWQSLYDELRRLLTHRFGSQAELYAFGSFSQNIPRTLSDLDLCLVLVCVYVIMTPTTSLGFCFMVKKETHGRQYSSGRDKGCNLTNNPSESGEGLAGG